MKRRLLAILLMLTLAVTFSFTACGSDEEAPAAEPEETAEEAVEPEVDATKYGYGGTDLSLTDILEQDSSLRYDYAYECLRSIGFYKAVSEDLARDSVAYAQQTGISLTDAVVTVACNAVAYVGCITIAFIMILILITALFDVINLDFHLPNADFVDEAAGAAMGFVKGLIYCVLFCWLLGFLGVIIGKDTCDSTPLISFFQSFRFFTRMLI